MAASNSVHALAVGTNISNQTCGLILDVYQVEMHGLRKNKEGAEAPSLQAFWNR